jgi:signal transduction histidine kinase
MRARFLAAASILGVAACAVAMLPQLQFAHLGMAPHLALETAASLIALLAGFLVFARLRRCGGLNDLLLADALVVLTLLNLCLLLMPGLAQSSSKNLMVWALLVGRSLAAALFALAAFTPQRRLWRPGLALVASVAGGSTIVMLMAAGLNGFAGDLTHHLALALSSNSPKGLALAQHPAMLALQLATAALYGSAAVGFFCRSRQLGDRFLGWLAISGVLSAFCYLNYSLYSYPYSQMVHTGDIFRLCFCTTLLIGSMIEIWSYWHALSEAAVLEERRRIACDLHDVLAQELAYVARNLAADREPSEERLRLLRTAVERAQLESRRVVSVLAATSGDPVEFTLANAAAEVAKRFQLRLQLDLAPGVRVSAAREDALVRIAREAVANAGRHSGASEVRLKLERDGPRVRLRVSDKGRGFDPALTGDGFGLVAMQQRACAVDGELRISSTPGGGSEVEVAL